jgi:NAD(P)H-hydrate epimerase
MSKCTLYYTDYADLISKQAISAKDAASLDKDLMDVNIGGWSLDQLMELAGLSVSQAGKPLQASNIQWLISILLMIDYIVWKMHPLSQGKNVLVVCGPGNNGMHS